MRKVPSPLRYWLPVLAWMGLIFAASCDGGSFQHSSSLVSPLVRWLFPHVTPQTLHNLVIVVRKGAHVTEYAILAVLLWRALRQPADPEPRPWYWRDAAYTLLLVIAYAASDEFHQRFVPSRDASVRDVLIDTGGGLLALALLWRFQLWRSEQLQAQERLTPTSAVPSGLASQPRETQR